MLKKTWQEPELEIISGTVRIEIPSDAAAKYTSMSHWDAQNQDQTTVKNTGFRHENSDDSVEIKR